MVDIDGTIFETIDKNYPESKPIPERIAYFNRLYDEGHTIKYWTARGSGSGKNWYDLTLKQLQDFGVKFHEFNVGKPSYDLWIDDKAVNADAYFIDRT
jgi:hypothetical protein